MNKRTIKILSLCGILLSLSSCDFLIGIGGNSSSSEDSFLSSSSGSTSSNEIVSSDTFSSNNTSSVLSTNSSSSVSSIVSSSSSLESSITSTSSISLDNSLSSIVSSISSSSKENSQSSLVSINNSISILEETPLYNGVRVRFKMIDGFHEYKATYEIDGETKDVDKELISFDTDNKIGIITIVGLRDKAKVKVNISSNDTSSSTSLIEVLSFDRSGYASFLNNDGVGAYKNDGTLKDNAQIVYVSNSNKNSVKATINGKSYTGLVNILKNQSKSSIPLNIRVLDEITTNQWKEKKNEPRLTDDSNYDDSTYWVNDFDYSYGDNLAGLTVKLYDKKLGKSFTWTTSNSGLGTKKEGTCSKATTKYTGKDYGNTYNKTVYDDDSYTNMLDVSEAKNVTIEGINQEAGFFQFGFNFSKCNSIEVRNVSFTDYPEDACSFSGSITNSSTLWVHNNVFNKGKNNWDITGERDKPAGDGAFDLGGVRNVTLAYNHFKECKKTGLVGGSDSVMNMNITFHHNFYDAVNSRLPLGRQANMHIYNNYYSNCSTCQDIRANAFVLSENNYFYKCKIPQKVTKNDTYKYTVIKSFGDCYVSCGSSQATKVSTRGEQLTGNCSPDKSTDYTNFDTNESLFYFDPVNGVSKVEVLLEASEVPAFVVASAGKY